MSERENRTTKGGVRKVVIVGAGFGGLFAAKRLAGSPVEVTIVDRRNHHLFQPLLYQVSTAALSPADIAWPIRSVFSRHRNVTVRLGEVDGIDTERRQVVIGGERLDYDVLVLATGARDGYFGNDAWPPRTRSGSRRSTTRPRSGAACCSRSNVPSSRPSRPSARR